MTKRKKNNNWPRKAIQWGVILAMIFVAILAKFKKGYTPDFEAYCPFGGIQALGSYLLNESLACTMTSAQIVMGVLLIAGVFLFSKLFCGYICPIGTISEWLGSLGDKLRVRITIKGIADKALRSLKYILLFITFYFTLGSNELFCKEFDPFYAIASGFDVDVVVLYAVIAISLVILGSVFIRLFWCKYLCPLGAISNIFKYTFFFLGVLAIYLILLKLGVDIHYAWPLGAAAAGGYILELTGYQNKIFPIAKITRKDDTCTHCQLCSIKCPQAIDVANMDTVKHADCNLCGECLSVCPEPATLQINKSRKLRWLPVAAVIALFGIGLMMEHVWEIPTIDQKWYTSDEMKNAETYSREGLKNIKCYGSSMAFASKMRKVKGVYGVATYVGTKKVKLYYDPDRLEEEDIEKLLFTPSKTALKPLQKDAEDVQEVHILLENFFDIYDFNYLSILLKQKTEAIGLLSEYSCPVIVKIYFPGTMEINEDELLDILESKTLTYKQGESTKDVELKYEVVKHPQYSRLSRGEYITKLFSPYTVDFNDFEEYDSTVVDVYTLPMGKNRALSKRYGHLVSHLSNNNGIIKFETVLNEEYKEMCEISFVDSLVQAGEIFEMINADSLHFTYSNGKTGAIENPFSFEEEGIVSEKQE